MGLTSALYTGLSGLNANQFRIDTIGDNIANVNTTAFKASRSVFQTQFSQTLSGGTPPSATSGGTNPTQVGLGAVLGAVQRSFTPGSIETTGVPTDLAIEGSGFFVVQAPDGQQYYTRDGAFKLNAASYLVTQDGAFVQGYGVDDAFNIVPGVLTKVQIPLGSLSTARASTRATLDGNLNPNLSNTNNIGTRGTVVYSQVFQSAAGALGAAPAATADTLLTSLYDPSVSTAAPLFAVGDEISITNTFQKNGRPVDAAVFTVTATSTLGDYLNFLTGAAGIDTNAGVNNPGWWISDGTTLDPANPGYALAMDLGGAAALPPAGTIVIEGNIGADNRLSIGRGGIASTNNTGVSVSPFSFSQQTDSLGRTWDANGESVYTSFNVYDSLGTPVTIDLTAVLVSTSDLGNTWQFFVSSPDDTDISRSLGNGQVMFDTDGQFKSVTGNEFIINRQNTGAVNPLSITIDLSRMTGFNGKRSQIVMTEADGFPAGTLTSFGIGQDGTIIGLFDNGMTNTLGQLALATFPNPEGLVAQTNNNYLAGPNAGVPVITTPESLGAGKILAGSLELSNVDLSREFIGLITATTGFSASTRVITTSNDLLNELLAVAR